jgi:transcriptional regulator with XRE-family HTH domain
MAFAIPQGMDFDAMIRAKIAASGKSERQIAEETGLPQPTVNRISTGRHSASTATLRKLCRVIPGLADAVAEGLHRAS